MKSIIQNEKRCFICGAAQPLHNHHCMNGYGLRKKADEDGLTVYLCVICHQRVHLYKEQLNYLKKIAQRKYLENHTYNEWMKRYKTNYLDDDELNDMTMQMIERGKDVS